MRIIITGRHMDVSMALRRYIERRMKRLEPYARNMGDVQVVVGVEKYRHTAEVIVRLNGRVIQGKTSTTEMYASVDQLVDKILRQVRKRKEQLVNHKPRHGKTKRLSPAAEAEPPPAAIQTSRPPLEKLNLEDAILRLDGEEPNLVVFVNAASGRVQIVRRLPNGVPELIDPQPA
jgi:putative sigma-54 modulation protein